MRIPQDNQNQTFISRAQIEEANKWHLSETIDWLLGQS
jgi:hypothetical protein